MVLRTFPGDRLSLDSFGINKHINTNSEDGDE